MITIVSHYYNNTSTTQLFLENYLKLRDKFPDIFELVLVDDHSKELFKFEEYDIPSDIRVYRVINDIQWNQAGARNIGVLESRSELVLICDIDHMLIESEDVDKLIHDVKSLKRGTRALLKRDVLKKGGTTESVQPHLNSFLMYKTDYWKIGGYDELFSGSYGDEDKYFQWCARKLGFDEVTLNTKLHVLESGATQGLNRDKSRNRALLHYLMSKHEYRAQNRFLNDYKRIL